MAMSAPGVIVTCEVDAIDAIDAIGTRVAPSRTSPDPEGGEKVPVRPVAVPPAPAKTSSRTTQTRRPGAKGATLSARIVTTAARWIYEGKRVDMQGLADE